MKNASKLLAFVLVIVTVLSLAACSSKYGALKKAFEKEGYVESEQVETWSNTIKVECGKAEDEDMVTNVHVLTKAGSLVFDSKIVLILEFKATDDMIEFYKNSETAQGISKDISEKTDAKAFYNELVEAGYAKGNCFVIPVAINANEITTIVKNA